MTLAISILIVLLATYWFGFKEGFFSGLIHLACVICAGAMAFAFWEPLAHTMLGGAMKEYAWGVSLLTIFCFSLFIFRLAGNLLIPDRLNFPHLADIIGGSTTGFASGVLTAGIGLIGLGFLPVGTLGGGFVRTQSNAAQPAVKSSISPAVLATESFYDTLSLGAFAPLTNRGSLATSYPALSKQAWGLQRDTVKSGRIELSISPDDITIGTPYLGVYPGSEGESFVLPVSVVREGFHRGSNFVLSASQAHLIGSGASPAVVFPNAWREGGLNYLFDGMTAYTTNVPGEQKVSFLLSFPASGLKGQAATALMFKGLRIPLAPASDDLAALDIGEGTKATFDASATSIPASYVKIDRKLGVILNRNSLASGMEAQKNTITFSPGADVPSRTRGSVNKSLRVDQLYELPGTKIVKLDISRGKSPIDVWGDIRTKAGSSAPLMLVDDNGSTYLPIGWLHVQASDNLLNVKLDARRGVPTIANLPQLSSAGRDDLDVLFSIPEGRRIVAIMVGDETVGVTNVLVK
ncbi:MAG: hypothetical protein CMJ51_01675 [Planctomycetaceae bacterium]|nr:hypothetical protein [Planctomycetaceae bacterium]